MTCWCHYWLWNECFIRTWAWTKNKSSSCTPAYYIYIKTEMDQGDLTQVPSLINSRLFRLSEMRQEDRLQVLDLTSFLFSSIKSISRLQNSSPTFRPDQSLFVSPNRDVSRRQDSTPRPVQSILLADPGKITNVVWFLWHFYYVCIILEAYVYVMMSTFLLFLIYNCCDVSFSRNMWQDCEFNN